MIRGSVGVGPFGTDWNVKFFMMFIAFGMCWYDQRTRKRNDYWWVLLFASVIWGLAELILQTLGIRDFSAKIMFGWNIPLWVSIPIQGIVEGGLVTVGSLFVGDRLLEKKSRFGTSLIFTLMMVILIAAAFIQDILLNYTGPDYGGNVPSRRNMFTPLPVILLIVMIVISIMFFIKAPPVLRRRGWMLFIVMILFGICWTLGEWGAGTRWIEVGTPPIYTLAPPLTEFLAFAWDIVVEIAFAYLPFFAIPIFVGLIRTETKTLDTMSTSPETIEK